MRNNWTTNQFYTLVFSAFAFVEASYWTNGEGTASEFLANGHIFETIVGMVLFLWHLLELRSR